MKELDIYGEKGKGGGSGPSAPINASDTLAATQTVKILLAISEGEIEGIEEIYLNQVPIYSDGAIVSTGANYSVDIHHRTGTADQTVIEGFTSTETPLTPFSPVPTSQGDLHVFAIPYDVDRIKVTFTLNSLKQFLGNGDSVGYTVSHALEVRPNSGATWTSLGSTVKSGKASSAYEWDVEIKRPAGVTSSDNWQIRIYRETANDDLYHYFSQTVISAITTIYDTTKTYPNTALVGITLRNAEVFGGSIPEVLIKAKGIKVKIPSNYNPVTHVYTESPLWDGSLTENMYYFTANPAWHIYYILNTSLGIDSTDIDIISLYNLSKHADELVSDGNGGQERRYELNNQFIQRENVPTFLMYLLSICNANFTTNEFGQISIMFDRANQPVTKQVTNANVVDGLFSYSSNDLESRTTLVNVTYNNSQYFGRTDTVTISEDSLIDRYGLQTLDIVLPGCTSQAQATRKARWSLYTNAQLTSLTTFKVLFSGLAYHVGELVHIYDNDNVGSVQAGLVVSFVKGTTTTTIVLDREITLDATQSTFYALRPNGTEIEAAIYETGITTDTITILEARNVGYNTPFIVSGDIKPRTEKVIKIDKTDHLYTITTVQHSEDKYTYIDSGVNIPPDTGDFVNISSYVTPPVGNISVIENFSSNDVRSHSKLQVAWDWPASGFTAPTYKPTYKVSYRRDIQQAIIVKDIYTKSYDIENPIPGIYEVTVWAINPFTGLPSVPANFIYDFRTSTAASTLLPPTNIYVTGTTGLIFNTNDLSISFNYNTGNDNPSVNDTLLDYVVEIWDSGTLELKSTYIVKPNVSNRGGLFLFSYLDNGNIFGTPTRLFNLKIYSRDVIGDVSAPAIVQVNNPVPVLTNWSVSPSFNAVYVKITPSTELDVAEYIIYRGTTPSFTKNSDSIIYSGPNTYVNLEASSDTTYYYAISIADSFGRAGSNISTEQSATSVAIDPDTITYTGLVFKPNNPSTNRVTWEAATATRTTALGAGTTWNIAAETTGKLWTAGILYIYYVPGDTFLSVETSLTAAVTAGGRILATYKGGTDITSDEGRAFISGDMLLAGTVGANALITNTAIITNAAQIGNVIQSDNYSWTPGAYSGWRVDKSGYAQFASMTIRDGSGNLVFSSGTGMEWGYISGKPTSLSELNAGEGGKLAGIAPGADVTGSNISAGFAGQGAFATLSQLNTSNISTYIANAAIGSAQIGSLALVGTSNFSVKSGTGGARQEMDNQGIRVYDAAGTLRVKIGYLG